MLTSKSANGQATQDGADSVFFRELVQVKSDAIAEGVEWEINKVSSQIASCKKETKQTRGGLRIPNRFSARNCFHGRKMDPNTAAGLGPFFAQATG